MTSQADGVVRLLQDATVALNSMGNDREFELPLAEMMALSMFSRARELVVSTALLLERRLPGPAFVLQRPLFEDAVLLDKIAGASPDDRLVLVGGWLRKSINALDRLARVGRALDPADTELIGSLSAHVAKQRHELAQLLQRKNLSAAKTFDYKKLAFDSGRGERDYFIYMLSHQAVHGNEAVHMMNRQRRDDGTILVGTPGDPTVVFASGLAIGSALQIMSAASCIAPISLPADHEGLTKRFEQFHAGLPD